MIHPPRKVGEGVYDEATHDVFNTEITDGRIIVRRGADEPAVWAGPWPGRIPADAKGLSAGVIREINKQLDAL